MHKSCLSLSQISVRDILNCVWLYCWLTRAVFEDSALSSGAGTALESGRELACVGTRHRDWLTPLWQFSEVLSGQQIQVPTKDPDNFGKLYISTGVQLNYRKESGNAIF